MIRTRKQYKGEDRDRDQWHVEVSQGELVYMVIVEHTEGSHYDYSRAAHLYTPSQARELAAALMAAADYVEANQ